MQEGQYSSCIEDKLNLFRCVCWLESRKEYNKPTFVVDASLEGVPVCKTGGHSAKWVRFPPAT